MMKMRKHQRTGRFGWSRQQQGVEIEKLEEQQMLRRLRGQRQEERSLPLQLPPPLLQRCSVSRGKGAELR
jgi:hypothetical protein